MTVQSIHHINLRVSKGEIQELRSFYCDVLGLTEGWRPPFASSGYWLYADGMPIVHLVEVEQGAAAATRSGSALDHVSLKCTNLDAMLAQLKHRSVSYRLSQVPSVGDTQVFFRDPVGTGIELTFSKSDSLDGSTDA